MGFGGGVSFSGLGSGIDTDSIVRQLMQLEALPLRRMQAQQQNLQGQSTLFGQLRSRLVALNSASSTLNQAATFNPIKAVSSDPSVATVSAGSSAASGVYSLEVLRLASAHRVASSPQASATAALGQSGTMMVNGRAVSVASGDSLQAVAAKINGLDVGVTASVVNGGAGNAVLTLTSRESGAANQLRVSDLSGNLAESLGLANGSASIRERVDADTVRGVGFSSATDKLATLVGSGKTGTIIVNGNEISVDFANDSLTDVAAKINQAGGAISAAVVQVTENGKTVQKLELNGPDMPAQLEDPDRIFEGLGVLQRGFGNTLTAGQDAQYRLDGLTLTSSTNTVTDVIPGVTLTFLKADATTPPKTTISFDRDNDKVKESMKAFMTAYNNVVDFLRQNSQFDKDSFASGPLFGNAMAAQVEGSLTDLLFTNLQGAGSIRSLLDVGFKLGSDGKLSIDDAAMDAALKNNLEGVRALMMSTGQTSAPGLEFVTGGNRTQSGTFQIQITQAATQARMVAGTAATAPNVGGEVLKFGGAAFSGTEVELNIDAGASLQQVVDRINSDTRLRDRVRASIEGGRLRVDSQRFGKQGDFTLVSNLGAAADTTGVGTAGGTFTAGLDVAGTINGEAATGNGQFLTGSATNGRANGLLVRYTGTSTGAIGDVVFSRGASVEAMSRLEGFTDSVNGALTAQDKSFQSQLEDLGERISSFQSQLQVRERTLRDRYLAMERTITRLQQQMAQLGTIR